MIRSITAIALLAIGLTTTVLAQDKEDLAAKAKITKAQAVKTVRRLWREGKIQSTELEKENGRLIWSFDIAMPDGKDIIEAHVDAKTGKVVSAEIETPSKEKKEIKAKAKEGKTKKQIKKSEKEDDDETDAKVSKKEGKGKKSEKKAKQEKAEEDGEKK